MGYSYIPLHVHSFGSLLDGLSKPWQIAARVRKIGASACAITEHGSLSEVVSFTKAMKNACKHCGHQPNQHGNGGKGHCSLKGVACSGYESDPMKPILGCEKYLCVDDPTVKTKENRKLSHLVVLAKNLAGWKGLIKAATSANSPEHFYYKPRLNLEKLAAFAEGNWVTFSGHPGSDLANCCFTELAAYGARSEEEARKYLKPAGKLQDDLVSMANKYRDLFGRDNFFVEIQRIDEVNMPAAAVVAKAMRWLSNETGIPPVATPDAHYPEQKDAADQRILLCSVMDTTLDEAASKLAAGEDIGLGGFFRSNRYHIPSQEEMAVLHTEEELANTVRIADMCEAYDILSKPKLAQFQCPDGLAPEDYLRQLCRDGWKQKVDPILRKLPKAEVAAKSQEYADRVKHELDVLLGAGLSNYFLIVWDICRYAQQELRCKKSKGRGSGAGSLVGYLLDIHDCNPIKFNLMFERFYNQGRNDVASGRVALPDYDMDFPIEKRDRIIDYIRDKYGANHVAQMATFGRMQGRSALTDVLRAHGWGSFVERKLVTAIIPDEAAISDELQEMREETGEASILRWTLENKADELRPWVHEREDGTLGGPLAAHFEQAMRLEGTKRSQGKHAAGIIISPVSIGEVCPMLHDKSTGRSIAGMDMHDLEAMGLVKYDVLGVGALDKCSGAVNTIRTGKVGAP